MNKKGGFIFSAFTKIIINFLQIYLFFYFGLIIFVKKLIKLKKIKYFLYRKEIILKTLLIK